MELKSSAFSEGERIPTKYTCDGPDISPDLEWSGVPAGTKSLALICDDPDAPAGTWVHWVIYNIPTEKDKLPGSIPGTATLSDGSVQGTNDFRRTGYGGPCPPKGPAHRYFFKLYALDSRLAPGPGATKEDIEEAMKGHILDEASLMGRYGR